MAQLLFRQGHCPRHKAVMSGAQLYDTIGTTYTVTRRTELRIAAQVWAALGDARTVLNVGAGTGSDQPDRPRRSRGRAVSRHAGAAPRRGRRRAWPPPRRACRSTTSPSTRRWLFCTVHHWQDPIAGLREMQRVARRVVVFTVRHQSTPQLTSIGSGSLATTCPRSPTCRVSPGVADRAGRRDRGPDRAGAHPVGLRRRLLRGLLAPARGVPGRPVSAAASPSLPQSGRDVEQRAVRQSSVRTSTSGRWAARNRGASSTSTKQTSARGCSSPERAGVLLAP